MARTTFTSIAVICTWIGTSVAAVYQSVRSQNKSRDVIAWRLNCMVFQLHGVSNYGISDMTWRCKMKEY